MGIFMRCSRLVLQLIVALISLSTLVSAQAAQHDRVFWKSIVQNKYAVPEGEAADALAKELSGFLGSPDPELRDELAYSILTRWIYSRNNILSTPALVSLTDEWRANLKIGLGESGTDSVLKRSFSALMLSSMARREAKAPFMGAERYHKLVAEAADHLRSERDLRGYDAKLHWIHATAHTADLLGALADNPMLRRDEAAAILSAIAERLRTAPEVYTQGEQDRLADAAASVIRRQDFDASSFAPWLARIQDADRDVWTATTVEALSRYQNHNYMLRSLVVKLALLPETPSLAGFRQRVLDVLKTRE